MAVRFYKDGNKIIYDNDAFSRVLEDSSDKVDVYQAKDDEGGAGFYVLDGPNIGRRIVEIGPDFQDKFGDAYSESRFVAFYRDATGPQSSVDVSTIAGSRPTIGTFGQLITGYEVRDIAVKWEYELYETNYDMQPAVLVGDGAQSFESGMLVGSSAALGSVMLKSKKATRYRTANGGFAWFTAVLDSGTGTVYSGLESDNGDRIIIRQINSEISFGFEDADGEVMYVPSSEFNGEISPSDIIWDNLNIFQVRYGYLGTADLEIYIRRNGRTQLLHIMKLAGTLSEPHVRFPQFRMCIYAEDGGTVKAGSWGAGTFSNVLESRGEDPSARPIFDKTQRVVEPGVSPSPIVAYRSKSTYNGFLHTVVAKLIVGKIASNSEGLYEVDFVFNPTTITGGTWDDINTMSSVMEVNKTVTSYAGGVSTYSAFLAVPSQGTGTVSVSEDFEKLGVFLNRDESVVITIREIVSGIGSNEQLLNFSWQELF